MRTTVTLDEALIRELMKFSDATTKTAAVSLAVKEGIRRAKLKQFACLLGTVDVDENAIEQGNRADMKRAQWLGGIGKENER